MTENLIEKIANCENIELFPLSWGDSASFDFITQLYHKEEKPIFEHSVYHVLSYLAYGSLVYAIRGNFGATVFVQRQEDFFLFTPRITDYNHFAKFVQVVSNLKDNSLEIRNVSKPWVDLYEKHSPGSLLDVTEVIPRSKEEAVYDVELVCAAEGNGFKSLRRSVSRLLTGGLLVFRPVVENNFRDANSVLDTWQKVQGTKYAKNRHAKEHFTLEQFVKFSEKGDEFRFDVGYFDGHPVSICVIHKVPHKGNWGVTYLTKGINTRINGGIFGVSDATYYHSFSIAKEWGLKKLNDGELGEEEGTRAHKLSFKPTEFVQSFDLFIIPSKNLERKLMDEGLEDTTGVSQRRFIPRVKGGLIS